MQFENHKVIRIALSLFPDKKPESLTSSEKQEVINIYMDLY